MTDRVGDRGKDTYKPTFFQNSEKVIPIPIRRKIKIKPITRKNIMKPIGQEVCTVMNCDWSQPNNFVTNQNKRKAETNELIGDGDLKTKKRRPGQ